jgi:type II secretory pathway component PulF
MAVFDYRGRNRRGELQIGSIESPDSQAVAWWMTSAGITPVSIVKRPVKQEAPAWMKRMLESNFPTWTC